MIDFRHLIGVAKPPDLTVRIAYVARNRDLGMLLVFRHQWGFHTLADSDYSTQAHDLRNAHAEAMRSARFWRVKDAIHESRRSPLV